MGGIGDAGQMQLLRADQSQQSSPSGSQGGGISSVTRVELLTAIDGAVETAGALVADGLIGKGGAFANLGGGYQWTAELWVVLLPEPADSLAAAALR